MPPRYPALNCSAQQLSSVPLGRIPVIHIHIKLRRRTKMRTKLSVTIMLVVVLALATTWVTSAQNGEPLTLNINLGGEPLTLDPALATDLTSVTVIEQLFIGWWT